MQTTELPNETEKSVESSFTSRWAKYRAVKKVKQVLPKSPQKRVEIIEKNAASPGTKKVLERKGAFINIHVKKQPMAGKAVIENIKKKLNETRTLGLSDSGKKAAHDTFLQAVLHPHAKLIK